MGTHFQAELRRLRNERRLSIRALAALVHQGKSYVHELETGQKIPSAAVAHRLDAALHAGGLLAAALRPPDTLDTESEIEAMELVRRVTASDVSHETLDRLEVAADQLAMAYATTSPADLLSRVRRHLDFVSSLADTHKTLSQHRRLIVVGAWLALLRATLHIDLRQGRAADAYLLTAEQMADHAGHAEVSAWVLETRAWHSLIAGDYRQAVDLSQRAQSVAPRDGSAYIQATAQEGRAWARLGDRAQTRHLLDRVELLAGSRPVPDHPEHHYRYDPAKAHSYAATTLAWAGDPAAEAVARSVITELQNENVRPRRVASARLDLGLALLAADKPDEAAAAASLAIMSGYIVASNWWRASEVVAAVGRSGIVEAQDLRDVYEAFRPAAS